MKQVDACALKDFDESRILSRPYFRTFGFDASKTDEQNLKELNYWAGQSLSEMETRLTRSDELFAATCTYQKILMRHARRLSKFISLSTQDKPTKERARRILHEYSAAIGAVSLLTTQFDFRAGAEFLINGAFRLLVGERLRTARTQRGFSQSELARKLGLTAKAIGHYENGRRDLPMWTTARVSRILEVPTDYLFFGKKSTHTA